MRKINYTIYIILVLTLSLCLTTATLQQGHPSFNLTQTSYGPNQTIEGFINLSLTNEQSDTKIKAVMNPSSQNSVTKEMSILEFLQNTSAIFNCSQNCSIRYSEGIPSNEKTLIFSNSEKEEKYLGVVATGNSPQIKNLSFKLSGSSSGPEVCGQSPLKLDLLDDGTYDFEYSIPSDDSWCTTNPKSSSCFNKVYASSESDLSSQTPYCQKISLNSTAKIEVSANLKLVTEDENGNNNVDFLIYNEAGNPKGNCQAEHSSTEFSLATCTIGGYDDEGNLINFFIQQGDYYVCVKKSSNSQATYSIKKETQSEVCGFYGVPPLDPVEDYEIYVREAKFKSFSTEEDQTFIANQETLNSMSDYINNKYQGNCTSSSLSCVIPLKFISLAQQTVILNEIEFKFQPLGTGESRNNNFYEITPVQPKINLSRQIISINALNLTSPEQQGNNYRVSMFYGSSSLGTIYFKVEQVPLVQNLTPLTVNPNQATTFSVIVIPNSGRQIINYTWNFGDGSQEQTTQIPQVTHTYNSGTYNLQVKATDSTGKVGSKTFAITTAISKESLTQSYEYKKQLFQNISNLQVESWYKDIVYNSSQINTTLAQLALDLNATTPDLNSIKFKLDSVKVPVSISNSLVLQESNYFPEKNNINLDSLNEIGAGNYAVGKEEETKNAITAWLNNINMRLGTTIKRIIYDDGTSSEITIATIKLSGLQDTTYFIFQLPSGTTKENTRIKETTELKELIDAIALETSSDVILTVALPLKQDVSQLVLYASPAFSTLKIEGGNPPITGPSSILFPIIVGVLVLLILIILLVIIWKNKKNSDDFSGMNSGISPDSGIGTGPFENPADLFNLISYIQSALAEGKKKKQIEEELLGQGWNKKQIDFAFKNKDNQNMNQGFNEEQTQPISENSGLPPGDFDELPDL